MVGAGAHQRGIAPQIRSGVLALAGAVHAGPGAECAGAHDGRAVRRFEPEGSVGGVRQTGEAAERLGRNKLGFAAELHGPYHRGQVHVAATLSRSNQCALRLHRAGKNCRACVGDAKSAIGMTVKTEFCGGKLPRQAFKHLRHFFRAGAAIGIAYNNAAHLLAHALFGQLAEMLEAALVVVRIAGNAVLAPAAIRVHSVLEIDENLKTVCVQVLDSVPGHEQVLFRRCSQRSLDVEQAGLDHHDCNGNVALVTHDEMHIGPIFHFDAQAARASE